jgi:hypothetical protein
MRKETAAKQQNLRGDLIVGISQFDVHTVRQKFAKYSFLFSRSFEKVAKFDVDLRVGS